MVSLEQLENGRLERLHTQADPVHSGCGQDGKFRIVQPRRISLDANLGPYNRTEPTQSELHQTVQLDGRQMCRRSSSEEERVHLTRLAEMGQINRESIEVGVDQIV